MEQNSKTFETYEYVRAALFGNFPPSVQSSRVYIQSGDFFDQLILALWQVSTARLQKAHGLDLIERHSLTHLQVTLRGHYRSEPWQNGFEIVRNHLHAFHPIDCCRTLSDCAPAWLELHGTGAEAIMRGRLEQFDPQLHAFADDVGQNLEQFSHPHAFEAAIKAWWSLGTVVHHS